MLLVIIFTLYLRLYLITGTRSGFKNVDARLLPSVEGGRGKSFGRHKDEGTRLVNAGPALLHTRCVYDLSEPEIVLHDLRPVGYCTRPLERW